MILLKRMVVQGLALSMIIHYSSDVTNSCVFVANTTNLKSQKMWDIPKVLIWWLSLFAITTVLFVPGLSWAAPPLIRVGTVQSSPQSPKPCTGTEPSVLIVLSLSVLSPSVFFSTRHLNMMIQSWKWLIFCKFQKEGIRKRYCYCLTNSFIRENSFTLDPYL